MKQQFGLVLAVVLCLNTAKASTVILHDASSNHLQRSGGTTLSQEGLAAALCSLGSLVPPYRLQTDESQDIGEVVKASLFSRPKALVLLHLAGVPADDATLTKLDAVLGDGISARIHVTADSGKASTAAVVQGAADIAAANADMPIRLLDHAALQGCNQACMEQHLQAAAAAIGARYEAVQGSEGPLSGALHLADGTVLRLQEAAARLFAIELASLHGAVEAHLRAPEHKDLHLYESTPVSIQALKAGDPAAATAATSALLDMVQSVKARLDKAYGGDVVYQVALLGDAPVASSDPVLLMDWKEAARRSLLASAGPRELLWPFSQSTEDRDPKAFSIKAAAYGAFLLLLYFTFGALYCMCTMKFKADSLLYGRSKAD